MGDPIQNDFIAGALQYVSDHPISLYGSRIEPASRPTPIDADVQHLHSLAYGLGSSPAGGLAQPYRFADPGDFNSRRNTSGKPAHPLSRGIPSCKI